jgi:hypothetical protein
MKQIPHEIAANALKTKRLENKNFWPTAPKNENSRVSYAKRIYNRALQHWLI